MAKTELIKNLSDSIDLKVKTKHRLTIVFSRVMVLLISICFISHAHAIVYVDKDRPGGTGTSWADAYNSIAAAIAASGESQEFWVAEGTYTPSPFTDEKTGIFPKQGSQFYGGFAGNETSRDDRNVSAHPVIIDGDPNNLRHVIFISDQAKVVRIDGFVIKGGSANVEQGWGEYGGGIFAAFVDEPGHTTTIANCNFENNTATEYGGAVFISGRKAIIENCVFQNNNSKAGGALGVNDFAYNSSNYDADLTVSDSTFNSNHANLDAVTLQVGGAIWTLNLSPVIQRSTFTGNTAGHLGGAIELNQSDSAVVSECEFTNNQISASAESGGGAIAGMWIGSGEMPTVTITSSTFQNNTSLLEGGGVYSYYCHMIIQDSRFQGNTAVNGGAVMLDYKMSGVNKVSRIENCLFMGNSATSVGGAVRSYARSTDVKNSVFAFNSAPNAGAVGFHTGDGGDRDLDYTASLTNCSFYGNTANFEGGETGYGGAVLNSFVPMLNIYNSIFWGNNGEREINDAAQGKLVGTHDVFNAGSSSMTTRYTDMETLNWEHASLTESHTGSFSSNPLFVDPDGADNTQGTLDDNLRLKIGSPCIDRADGDNAVTSDIASTARFDAPYKPNLGTGTPNYGDLGPYESTDNLVIVPQISTLLDE